MKNLILSLTIIGGLFITSCTKDDVTNPVKNYYSELSYVNSDSVSVFVNGNLVDSFPNTLNSGDSLKVQTFTNTLIHQNMSLYLDGQIARNIACLCTELEMNYVVQ